MKQVNFVCNTMRLQCYTATLCWWSVNTVVFDAGLLQWASNGVNISRKKFSFLIILPRQTNLLYYNNILYLYNYGLLDGWGGGIFWCSLWGPQQWIICLHLTLYLYLTHPILNFLLCHTNPLIALHHYTHQPSLGSAVFLLPGSSFLNIMCLIYSLSTLFTYPTQSL